MSQKEDILRVLEDAEGPLKQKEIADRMGVTRQGIWENLVENLYKKEEKVEKIGENPRKWVIAGDVNTATIGKMSESSNSTENKNTQNISLERDVQKYLYKNLDKMKEGLTTNSDRTGKEIPVDSGRIDILAEDLEGEPVIIEIKTGEAKRNVLGQIKAYMADILSNNNENVTGVIVAEDFSTKLTKAITLENNIELYTYKVKFDFNVY